MTYSVGYWENGERLVLDGLDAYESLELLFVLPGACRVELSTVAEANARNRA